MDNQPSQDLNLQEAMEACRPGHDDQSDPVLVLLATGLSASPELRERFSRQQRLDATLAKVIREAPPVPAGLADRLLAGLGAAGLAVAGLAAEPAPALAPRAQGLQDGGLPAGAMPAPVRPIWARRLGLYAATMAAAALLMIAIGLIQEGKKSRLTRGTVLNEAVSFFSSDTTAAGRRVDQEEPPSGYPMSPAVRQLPGTCWRQVSGLLETEGVAYDMTSPQGTRATLYVLRLTVPDLRRSRHRRRQSRGTDRAVTVRPLGRRAVSSTCCGAGRGRLLPEVPREGARPDHLTPVLAHTAQSDSLFPVSRRKRGQAPFVRSTGHHARRGQAVPAKGACPLFLLFPISHAPEQSA